MSEKEENEKTDEQKTGKTLSLKRTVDSGQVRQNFSHGRTKSVQVERKRKRMVAPANAAAPSSVTPSVTEPVETKAPEVKEQTSENNLGGLSRQEQAARQAAVADAKVRAAEEAIREKEEAEKRALEEAERLKEEAKRKLESPDITDVLVAPVETTEAPATPRRKEPARTSEDTPARRKEKTEEPRRPAVAKRGEQQRRRTGKLTINDALNDEERMRSMASIRRRREREKRQSMSMEPREKVARTITLPESITIQELANRMAERAVDVIKLLMQQGVMAKINDTIDADTAELIAEELGHKVNRVTDADVEDSIDTEEDTDDDKKPRPPVVTVMGHVDHGKTSLLDALRKTSIVTSEAGGITQHIGAYQVTKDDGEKVTFIDTPGHAAFTSMRARGAKVTDIVILVVAADDGVMPQTVEAISHAKAAEVPIVVAVNKIDKPEADPTRVKNELLQHEIISEDMGGDVQFVEVSALAGTGLDDLLESVLLQAELLDLKANPYRAAEGIVIESKLEKGRGAVATVLVQRGTLSVGDIFVVGEESGRVRALLDDQGESIKSALPASPVEVLGAGGSPSAGDMFNVVETEAKAREIAEYRARISREKRTASGNRTTLDQMMQQLKDTELKELPIVVKADVQGSAEAISQAVDKLGTDEVCGRVVHTAVGGITESDITLAAASNASILGFNVRANSQARNLADEQGVEIRYYNVIYDLVDDMKAAMSGMLSPDLRETMLGNAEILEIFNVSKSGKVAGCKVTDGLVRRGARVRLIRDSVVIHEGELSSLRRFKDEVKEVNAGQECGMAFENYEDLKQGDVIECYEVEEIARTLDDVN
ncbi:Recombination protein RecR [Candidatus Micropelagos thuwalensis]|uniref:Translation initiation factor IF-2 n=1 Tax=Candidatus Micropelagius thuwalensis TaxID=1397666 RepID=U2WT08_9PROT|nr:translation initiation factor IF-2 [Candidatus Micropelagos thuwalensis]ERL46695.1 Recombination protein RecR [Candidatus Micropelagos thuwalensis]